MEGEMPKKKTATKPAKGTTTAFEPDAYVIRTSAADGRSHNGFIWPREIGATVECPDWAPTNECGNGLHGCLDGVGDWSLLSSAPDALWWVIGVRREECIDLGGKVKFPRGKIAYAGGINGALRQIAQEWKRIADEATKAANASDEAHTTADNSHASTAGECSHASTAGRYSHASTAGKSSHASTAGRYSHASTAGAGSVSCGLGFANAARAGAGGAICLVHLGADGEIIAIRASKVGENGIRPDVLYRLSAAGEFEEVDS